MGWRRCSVRSASTPTAVSYYEPVDIDTLLYYKEAEDGQILEEGINEAGSISSFIAAGTAYATHGINTIPFFIFYSMFGFQRIGDLIWAGADMRMRGFVLGGTAGRTTLNGEGLQHQDGNSHVLAMPVPTCQAYDPAFAYELAVIIEDGIKRMYGDQENIFYYLTLMNEQYEHPPMPEGARDGILKGMYLFGPTSLKPTASCARSCLAAARSSSRRSRRRRSSRRGTASARTCGASRATSISIAMGTPASAGIGCIRATSHACRTSRR